MYTWFRFLPREPNYEACYALDVTAVQTGIMVERDATTGKLLGFKEVVCLDVATHQKLLDWSEELIV